jgi:hypothetical protein
MVKCQSLLSFGTASLSGIQGIYKSFREDLVFTQRQVQGIVVMPPKADPLYTMLMGIAEELSPSEASRRYDQSSMLLTELGYNITTAEDGSLNYAQPSLDIFAGRIWDGVAHMTVGLGLLSSTSDTVYPAVVRYTTSGRTRSSEFVVGSFALLALWMSGLIYVSIRSYRLSNDSSLGSYIAARLHAQDPRLYVEDVTLLRNSRSHSGESSGEEGLNSPFVSEKWVGR